MISNLRFMILILLLVFYLLYTQMSLILHFPCSEKGRKKQSKSPYSSPPPALADYFLIFFPTIPIIPHPPSIRDLRISRFLCSKRHSIVSQSIWKFSKHICWNICTYPCSFSYCIKNSMKSSLQKDKITIRTIVINYRERYQKPNMPSYSLIC